jgi:hypothetical protein
MTIQYFKRINRVYYKIESDLENNNFIIFLCDRKRLPMKTLFEGDIFDGNICKLSNVTFKKKRNNLYNVYYNNGVSRTEKSISEYRVNVLLVNMLEELLKIYVEKKSLYEVWNAV